MNYYKSSTKRVSTADVSILKADMAPALRQFY